MTQKTKTKLLKKLTNKATEMNAAIAELIVNGETEKALEMANQVCGLLMAYDLINEEE